MNTSAASAVLIFNPVETGKRMRKTLISNRIMAYCLASATPLLLMALVFNFPLLFNGQFLFWTSQESLGYIIQAEFLAVATGVLVILPLII
jgi:hypothetical protein